ncbi:hypothetical protein MRX96_039397 [Rhipicephalus microplus]
MCGLPGLSGQSGTYSWLALVGSGRKLRLWLAVCRRAGSKRRQAGNKMHKRTNRSDPLSREKAEESGGKRRLRKRGEDAN